MRKTIAFLALLVLFFTFAPPTHALKKRTTTVTPKRVSQASTGARSYSSLKLSRPTNSVLLSLFNLDKASKVSYELSYTASGIPQGAVGSIVPNDSTGSRDLYFGTCSKGVCTPHVNIKNAVVIVRTSLKTGGIHTKRYVIRL